MKENDPVAAYFDKLPETHKRQFEERASGANFNFQQRLTLACELGGASSGRLLDCAAGTGEITCALLKSGRFNHATVVDVSPAMLQSAKDLLTSQIKNAELEFVQSDVFNFKPSDSRFDLILCLGLIAHTGRLDILLPHLKSMLTPGGRIILQTTLTDHLGTRIVRALTSRSELARRGYRHFLVLPTKHLRRVRPRRVADSGDAAAQPRCSIRRSLVAVGEFSTGNSAGKMGEPPRSRRNLSARSWMRVGFLVSSVSREAGGLFQSVRGLAKAVASTNANVRVFGIRDEQSAVDLQEWRPLSVQTFRPRLRAWGYSNQLVPAMLDADLDILSVHGLWKYCSVGSQRWHRQTGRPYVVHPHGMLDSWALRNARWKKRIAAALYENQHLRGAACLRALSEAEAQSIRSYGLRNPICVIPNGVDLPDLRESNAKTQSANRKTLLYLGRLHPKKNISNLIRAWNETFNSQPGSGDRWVLAIAGWDQGGYESELKRIAAGPSVVFLGPQFGADKSECYRTCDAFILPSLSEGLPMTVLEAWAHAKPVLMTPECNLPEGFEANAALRIGTTPEEIAAGLKVLREMSDTDRSQMGNRGRALVATRFSWPRIGEQMRDGL